MAETIIDFTPSLQHTEDIIRDPSNLKNACERAEARGIKFIEVEPEVFDHFMNGQDTRYFCYGKTRVYIKGTREKIEVDERKTIYG